MAKRKVTITIDPEKADRARSLTGAVTTSGVVDLALDTLIRRTQLANDIAAYRRTPTTEEETQMALRSEAPDVADETDWLSLYEDLA